MNGLATEVGRSAVMLCPASNPPNLPLLKEGNTDRSLLWLRGARGILLCLYEAIVP